MAATAAHRCRGHGEGLIRHRPDGRWESRITLPDGRLKSFYGKTRADVQQKLVVALKAQQDGLPVATNDRVTVGQYLKHWLETSESSVRASTHHGYEAKIRIHMEPALGKIPLTKLQPQTVETFLNNAKRANGIKLSAQSVHHLRAILRAALSDAVKKGLVARNVAALANEPQVQRHEIRPLTPEEARKLLDAVKGDRLEALYSVAMALGLRQGEALGLHWADVDLKAKTLRVRTALQRSKGEFRFVEPKSARSWRTIALPDAVVDALQGHKERQDEERKKEGWEEGDLVFCMSNGTPLYGTNLTKTFQRLLKNAKLPRQRFHDLRHTCASLLLAQGVHPRVVMEVLGHSNIALTMNTYSHVIPDLQREAAAKMDAILAGADPALLKQLEARVN